MLKTQNKSKLFECGLGFHEYTIPDKTYPYILICKHCKKYGYWKSSIGHEGWFEYDNKGNIVHFKNNGGYESWRRYDNKGNCIYFKNNGGLEGWLHKGNWVHNKPINWEHENEQTKI